MLFVLAAPAFPILGGGFSKKNRFVGGTPHREALPKGSNTPRFKKPEKQ